MFLLSVFLNNSCEGKFSQRCMDFKRQLTCCHEADYKAFVMLFVIKQKQLKKKKRLSVNKCLLC